MKQRKIKPLFYLIIASVLVELILSNITYLNLLNCDTKNQIATIVPMFQRNEINLRIETKELQIQNIKIYYKEPKNSKEMISYTPIVCVEGLQNEVRTLSTKYSIGNQNTKINLNSEQRCLELNLQITGLESEEEIEKIVINDTNIEYSIPRIVIIFLIFLLLYYLKKADKQTVFQASNPKQSWLFYGIIGGVFIFFLLETLVVNPEGKFLEKEISYAYTFLNPQVEALLNKTPFLTLQPSDELLALENPYDETLRREDLVCDYKDYSFYKGKFYSYFGLAPIILLMLPFKLLTGYYISNLAVTILFFIMLLLTFAKLYTELVKRYIQKITYFNYVLGFITILFSALTMYLLRGWGYDVVTICAILFTLLSYGLILSIYENPTQKVYRKILACSICMGLMILSKPTYIAYYIILFYLLINLNKKLKKTEFLNSIKVFVVPISIIAMVQMWWNYVRFDSIFCFGAKYQLTVFDMQNLTYFSPIKLLKGFCQYLFTMPNLNFDKVPFYFVQNYGYINYDFNVITYDAIVLGIFTVPIAWIYWLYRPIQRQVKLPKEFRKTMGVFVISCFTILILNSRNGVTDVYVTDVKLGLYTVAILLYFKLLETTTNPLVQKMFWILCTASILLTIPFNLTLGHENIDSNVGVYLKNIFEFWL